MEDLRVEVIALRSLLIGTITQAAIKSGNPVGMASGPFGIARKIIEAENMDADLHSAVLEKLDAIKTRINVG